MTDIAAGQPIGTHAPEQAILRRHVAAAVAGNALEFYDFLTYSFFALQIGHAFFPVHSAFGSLMLSLGAFGAGFIFRPVGAVVIGYYADRVGRRPAMLLTLGLMGTSILGLALTPSYAAIGALAPVLVLIWRLIQGFALGGEVGPTTAYLIEAAPPGRRGFYGAWQGASQQIASMAGGLVGLALSAVMSVSALDNWGWRIAFLVGGLTLPFALWLRRSLPETLHRAEAPSAALPSGSGVAGHGRIVLLGLGLILASTVTTYVLNYMTTYARTTLHIGAATSLAAPLVMGLAGIVFGLSSGALSDLWGRKSLMVWPRVVMIALIWPAFALMVARPGALTFLGGVAVMGALLAMSGGAVLVAITESFRKDIRSAGVATVYATAVAVFGGTTQPMIAWLIHVTGDPLSPAWYMIGANIIGLVAAVLMKETAPRLASASRSS